MKPVEPEGRVGEQPTPVLGRGNHEPPHREQEIDRGRTHHDDGQHSTAGVNLRECAARSLLGCPPRAGIDDRHDASPFLRMTRKKITDAPKIMTAMMK